MFCFLVVETLWCVNLLNVVDYCTGCFLVVVTMWFVNLLNVAWSFLIFCGWLVAWLRCSWILDNTLWLLAVVAWCTALVPGGLVLLVLAVACWQQSTSRGILSFPAVAVVHCIALVLDWLPLAALVVYYAAYWHVIKYVIWIMILTCAAAGVMILICDRHSGLSSRFPPVFVIFPPIFVRFRTPVFSTPAPDPGLSDPDPVSDNEM